MFSTLISFYLMLSYVNPTDPEGKTIYPSGIWECDNKNLNRLKSSPNPILKLIIPVYDIHNKIITPGIYEISSDKDKLYLLQSRSVIGEINVLQSIKLDKKIEIPEAKMEIQEYNKVLIIYRFGDYEKQAILKIPGF